MVHTDRAFDMIVYFVTFTYLLTYTYSCDVGSFLPYRHH